MGSRAIDREAAVKRARRLRRNPSVTERLLWERLRQRRLEGLKFRRQMPLGPYVLDFICLRHRLVVEADGPFHDPVHDAARDAWLLAMGFQVLRFSNPEICGSPHTVAERLLATLEGLPSIPRL